MSSDTGEGTVGESTRQQDTEPLVFDADTEVKIAYASAAITIIGAFLPWATVLGTTVLGIDGDGIITLLIAAIVGGAVYYLDWEKRLMMGTMVAGAVVFLIPFGTLSGFSAVGVYVTMVGGVGMIVAGQSGFRRVDE